MLITPAGVDGVRPGVTLAQVKHRLGVTFAGVGWGKEVDGAICGGALQGKAEFAVRSGVARLTSIAFTHGVRTKEGIAPGATFRQLRRAYGRRLRLDPDTDAHTGDYDVVRAPSPGTYDLVFVVDADRVVSVGLVRGVLDVRCPTVSTSPPPTIGVLSLQGASGLQPVMPENQVLAMWPWFPFITESAGSGWDSWMPVCAGATRGTVQFGGGALASVWLTSGVSTDTGITIGSTVDALQSAYGSALQTEVGDYVVYAEERPPVATLEFVVRQGIVTAIGFGGRQSIGSPLGDTVWC